MDTTEIKIMLEIWFDLLVCRISFEQSKKKYLWNEREICFTGKKKGKKKKKQTNQHTKQSRSADWE